MCWFITAVRYRHLRFIPSFPFSRDRSHTSQHCFNGEVASRPCQERHSWRGWRSAKGRPNLRQGLVTHSMCMDCNTICRDMRREKKMYVCVCVYVNKVYRTWVCHHSGKQQQKMWYTRTSDQTSRPEISKSWAHDGKQTCFQHECGGSMRGCSEWKAKDPPVPMAKIQQVRQVPSRRTF